MSKVHLHEADCREWLAAYAGPLFDAVVTDPPYEIGFMGKAWDSSGVAFQAETWRAVFDKMKPGAHLAAFGGTRTYHRMAVAIEDAGFEIRDQLAWAYGSGFPKSLNVSKAIDKAAGVEREVAGFDASKARQQTPKRGTAAFGDFDGEPGNITAPATDAARQWSGWGTALKPAWEPICLARKPFDGGTVAGNVLKHGCGAINVDACRVEGMSEGPGSTPPSSVDGSRGRFPANLLHDGSAGVIAAFPETESGSIAAGTFAGDFGKHGRLGTAKGYESPGFVANSGSAARFFYSAKAGPLDRIGSEHATVKPVDLMRWLARLITPPGGLILDPFAGSGTTGIAAMAEGFLCEMVEVDAVHAADIRRKLEHLTGKGRRTVRDHLTARKAKAVDDAKAGLPLFGGGSDC